jgi:tetratricopeptide (TPR) repeat protein
MQKILLPLLLFATLISCKSTQGTAINRSIVDYRQGNWLQSELWAKKSIQSGKSIARAQYMIGLCEFKREHPNDAQEWFIKATKSPDPEVRGKASAMLGIISSNKGNLDEAETAFEIAALELQGNDQLEAIRRSPASGSTYLLSNSPFTLQFGAFQNRKNANAAIAAITPSLKKAGINSVWITSETDRTGRHLFLVQAGQFASRATASEARRKNNLPQCIVTVIE